MSAGTMLARNVSHRFGSGRGIELIVWVRLSGIRATCVSRVQAKTFACLEFSRVECGGDCSSALIVCFVRVRGSVKRTLRFALWRLDGVSL